MNKNSYARSLKNIFLTLCTFFSLCVVLITPGQARADTYHFHENNVPHTWGVSWKNRYIDSTFDTVTKTLTWEAQFEAHDGSWPYSSYAGRVPEGFHLVISEGPMPSMGGGEYASFYFDASVPSNPKLTVYGFSGDHYFDGVNFHFDSYRDGVDNCAPGKACADTAASEPSVQTPDRIASSLVNSSFVNSLTVRDEFIGGKQVRTLGFSINASGIINRTPLYPTANAWKGTGFGTSIGYWFHAAIDMQNVAYTNGYLSSWLPRNYQFFDPEYPSDTIGCSSNNNVSTTWSSGAAVQLTATGFSNQGALNFQLVTPPSSFYAVRGSSSSSLITNVVVNGTAPASNTSMIYNTGVRFTNNAGVSVFCPLSLLVAPNAAPVCNISGASTSLSCANSQATLTLNGSGSFDSDRSPSALTYAWSTNCPAGVFAQQTASSSSFSFSSMSAGSPVSCTVGLTVSDGLASTSCQATVGVTGCTRDCAGVINGTAVFDACGVCGGNGVLDRCGVCNGDGNSCLGCVETNNTTTLATLDHNSQQQLSLVKRANNAIKSATRNTTLRRRADRSTAEARAIHLANWQIAWAFPAISRSCSNTTFCTQTDTTSIQVSYQKNSSRLYTLLKQAIAQLKTLRRGKLKPAESRLMTLGTRLYNQNVKLLSVAPQATSTCT